MEVSSSTPCVEKETHHMSQRLRSDVGKHYQGELGAAYFEYQRRAASYAGRLNRRKFERHLTPNDVVVDFGCAAGDLLDQLNAKEKIGVEANGLARAKAAERGLAVVASTRELESAIADVVISNHALEHTVAPLDELRELRRVLVPGGKAVFSLPIDDWRGQRKLQRPDPDHHLYTWTPRLLRNLLDEAGFDVVDVRVVTHAWPPFTETLARMPERLFDALAVAWSVVKKRRQLMAVARRPT
jgi:SAM-dependent methyltransferase